MSLVSQPIGLPIASAPLEQECPIWPIAMPYVLIVAGLIRCARR